MNERTILSTKEYEIAKDRLLNVSEFARHCGCSRQAIYKAEKRGDVVRYAKLEIEGPLLTDDILEEIELTPELEQLILEYEPREYADIPKEEIDELRRYWMDGAELESWTFLADCSNGAICELFNRQMEELRTWLKSKKRTALKSVENNER